MDPSQCTLVILAPSHYSNINKSLVWPYIDILQAVFDRVLIAGSGDSNNDNDSSTERILQQKQHHNTLFFMDLDTLQDQDDQTSISSSSSLSTSAMDDRLAWVKKMAQHFTHHPVIVCSSETNSTFMLDCLHAGAADYLAKPLHLPVIQTLFLKLHRRQGQSSSPNVVPITSSLSPSSSSSSSSTLTTGELDMASTTPSTSLHGDDEYYLLPSALQPEDINHRFKEIVTKDIQLTKAMMDIYAPPLPSPTKYIPLSSRQADDLKLKLTQWDFSPFEFNHDELIHCVYLIFEMTLSEPDLSHLALTQDQLYDFIIDLANAYHEDNPYHNFAHAVDVLQCIYYFLCQLGVLALHHHAAGHSHSRSTQHLPQHVLQPKHAFALLLSAIGHDAGHPGVNNMFLINSRTPLAVMYNDRSVLESLHSMTLFQLIKRHGLDQWWTGDDYQVFRHIIISSILATDMALNNDYVKKFKQAATEWTMTDHMLLCTALIKCADVSNVTRPFRRGKEWAQLLVEEFASQGDLERELGMPVLATNDRTKIILEECQIGFIQFVALDLFTTVSDLLPELDFTLKQMKQNLQLWELEKRNQVEKKQQLESPPKTITTTAVTKRRLSYCLEASTPPSLNTPSCRCENATGYATSHHHHHRGNHYLDLFSSLTKKRRILVEEHHQYQHHHHHPHEQEQLIPPAPSSSTTPSSSSCTIQ